MDRRTRQSRLAAISAEFFDVAVVGGGVHGCAIFHHLCKAGYRVLLLEAGDYASGTSQASAMMIWGGLLYLRNADLGTIWRLSRSREELLALTGIGVRPLSIRYLGEAAGASRRPLVRAAFHMYWLLGGCQRRRPTVEMRFSEQQLLSRRNAWTSLTYEEGCVEPSDARFVLSWLLTSHAEAGWAFNYCRLAGGGFDRQRQCWQLDLEDRLDGRAHRARVRWVINASGIWTDQVNAIFQMETPYRHLFSKGVFLGLPRSPYHERHLILGGDNYAWMPWGPVSLWGPTETVLPDREKALSPSPEDVRFLLAELNPHLRQLYAPHDIISMRSGVRPIAVLRGDGDADSRKLSRRPLVWFDRNRPWASVYGGNITAAIPLAREVLAQLHRRQSPRMKTLSPAKMGTAKQNGVPIPMISFPGLPGDFPAPEWCAAHEDCWHLDDYLRRRTNIAQWAPRGGLGFRDENLQCLVALAERLGNVDREVAQQEVARYRETVHAKFDQVLAEC